MSGSICLRQFLSLQNDTLRKSDPDVRSCDKLGYAPCSEHRQPGGLVDHSLSIIPCVAVELASERDAYVRLDSGLLLWYSASCLSRLPRSFHVDAK